MAEDNFLQQDLGQGSASNVTPSAPATSPPGDKPVSDYLPTHLKELYQKELLLVCKACSPEPDLLKKGIATEGKFLKEWGHPTDCSTDGCTDEQINTATAWLKGKQCDLEEKKTRLVAKKDRMKCDVEEQEAKIARLEAAIDKLLKSIKALPAEIKVARERVTALLTEANSTPDGISKTLIQNDLRVAEDRLQLLCGTRNPDPAKECTADYEKQLHQAVSENLTRWRSARTKLRELWVGTTPDPECKSKDADNLNALDIKIKSLDKQLEYIKSYWDVLVAKYLIDNKMCTDSAATAA